MLRVVLDTNVFISSLLTKRGATAQVLEAWRQRRFLLVISPAIIAEITRVLRYPHIQHKYAVQEEDIMALADLLQQEALLVPGKSHVTGAIPADMDDEIILACAVDGMADCIVSGDSHLLDLGQFREIPIWTVREFLEKLAD